MIVPASELELGGGGDWVYSRQMDAEHLQDLPLQPQTLSQLSLCSTCTLMSLGFSIFLLHCAQIPYSHRLTFVCTPNVPALFISLSSTNSAFSQLFIVFLFWGYFSPSLYVLLYCFNSAPQGDFLYIMRLGSLAFVSSLQHCHLCVSIWMGLPLRGRKRKP